jgi:hypothetical protein
MVAHIVRLNMGDPAKFEFQISGEHLFSIPI